MKRLDWFIARHYLRAGRGLLSLITWIALGGVVLGVGALITVISVMSGMQDELRGKILESTPHLYVLEWGSSLTLHDYEQVVDSILGMDEVVGAAPFAMSAVSVMRKGVDYSQPAHILGVDLDTTRVVATDMERSIVEGALDLSPPESGLAPLLMGSVLADRLAIFEGDTLVVLSMENVTQDLFGTFQPTIRQFEITGTFTTGMYEYDIQNVYTTLEAAQDLIGIDSMDASGIGVRIRDAETAIETGVALGDWLGSGYSVDSWIVRNRALFSALQLEKLALGVIVFLIVIVAAFNIVSTLVMVVSDRTAEIGILRTMGMTQDGILGVFVLQGVWIGVIGTAVGTTLGVGISWALERFELVRIPGDVYFVDHLPATLSFVDIGLIVLASVGISFAATIYPALRASKLDPVDAIRHG